MGRGRRGLWGWVLGSGWGSPVPPCAPGADPEAAAVLMWGFGCVRLHSDRAHFPRTLPFSLPLCLPPDPCSDLSKGLRVIHAAAHFNSSLEVSGGPWALTPATFREAVRGLQGASLDAGLLLSCFSQAASYIY